MSDRRLCGACGLYCGACHHYRASFAEGRHLLPDGAAAQGTEADYTCDGCRASRLYVHPGCRECRIRACCVERGVEHCGLCGRMPCELLITFRDDGHVHHLGVVESLRDLARLGVDAWLQLQQRRWTCECGYAAGWYEPVCPRCGRRLQGYRRPAAS